MLAPETEQGLVHWTGHLPRERIAERFAGADLFVLSSYFEGFPRVLMEAAASALPTISTMVSGADEAIIDGSSGHLVPVGDASAFARRIVELAERAERRAAFGDAARRHITQLVQSHDNTAAQVAIWERVTELGRSRQRDL
jgi:glycosyltransferase involved in cell wall biosynthesis